MTDTAVYTTEGFAPDLRAWEITWTAPDGSYCRRAPVVGWLTITTTHDGKQHVMPGVLDGGQVVPARLAGPKDWTMTIDGGHVPTLTVGAVDGWNR